MYFSKIELRREKFNLCDIVRMLIDEEYKVHRLLWSLFRDRPDRKRDFLYRSESHQGWPCFYTVSARQPVDSAEVWQIQSKPYSPKVVRGQQLGFSLRVNPVLTRRDDNNKQHRHDVVMEAKYCIKRAGMIETQRRRIATLVQEQGAKWLSAHAEKHGFIVNSDEFRVDGYKQHRFFKEKGKTSVSFSTVDFNGVLTVLDPQLFTEALYKGIGPAKGFGCGMFMIRRI